MLDKHLRKANTERVYSQLFKIWFIWGVLLAIVGNIISFIASFTITLFNGSGPLTVLVFAPFSLALAWFAGYKAVKSSLHINKIEKISRPFWTGMGVGFTSVLLSNLLYYFMSGNISFGSGILIAAAAGFGGRMAASKR